MNEQDPHPNPGRGIYLLPNLFTTAALFSGFYAILSAVDGRFEHAAVAIFAAMILDGLDGRVARMTHTQTDFGAEYDSLSDMIAFGLAPGLVVYLWALQPLGKFGWFAAFVYVAAAALRLARFNTQAGSTDKSWFIGLPSPSAAAVTAGWVWMMEHYEVSPADVSIVSAILTIFAGIAMVTRLRYYSFKEINMRGRIPFMVLAAIAFGIAVVLVQPATVLFLLFLLYSLSGVVTTLARKRRLRKG